MLWMPIFKPIPIYNNADKQIQESQIIKYKIILSKAKNKNPIKMSTQRQVFCTSFFLHNSTKGFFLHKTKKHNITSTFKFKSKINNNPNINSQNNSPLNSNFALIHDQKLKQKYRSKSKQRERQKEKQMLIPYRQDVITEELYRDAREKIGQSRKFRSLHFQYSSQGGTANPNCEIQDSRNDTMRNRYEKVKIAIKKIQPTFPEIENKRNKISTKTNRITEDQQDSFNIQNIATNQKIIGSKTIQNNIYPKINNQIQQLIKKQVLKTQNQAILRQGQLKFDQKQAFQSKQQRKRFNSTKKRRKKNQDYSEDLAKDQNLLQKMFGLEGPQAKSFNLTPITYQQTFYQKQRSKQRTKYKKMSLQKIARQKYSQFQKSNQVQGWENQNDSSTSQVLDQDINNNLDRQSELKSILNNYNFKSQRLN